VLPIDISQPGRRYVMHATDSYVLYAHAFGCFELVARDNGASVFFQGDDATQVRDEVTAFPDDSSKGDWLFDMWASEYDHVMTVD